MVSNALRTPQNIFKSEQSVKKKNIKSAKLGKKLIFFFTENQSVNFGQSYRDIR